MSWKLQRPPDNNNTNNNSERHQWFGNVCELLFLSKWNGECGLAWWIFQECGLSAIGCVCHGILGTHLIYLFFNAIYPGTVYCQRKMGEIRPPGWWAVRG